MTSGGLGLSEDLGQDISQEELDFSDVFLYNSPAEDFPVGCDKGAYETGSYSAFIHLT